MHAARHATGRPRAGHQLTGGQAAGQPAVPAGSGPGWAHPVDLALGRLPVAGLLAWMGWIHLHLWSGGYSHVPTIGPLFLANFVVAVTVALAVLAAPVRLLVPAAAGAVLTAAGTLMALILSVNVGLFGFRDSSGAPFAHLSVWVEALAVVAGSALVARAAVVSRRGRA